MVQVLELVAKGGIKGIAHITGGGFTDNIPRVFPKGLGVEVNVGESAFGASLGKFVSMTNPDHSCALSLKMFYITRRSWHGESYLCICGLARMLTFPIFVFDENMRYSSF